MAVSPLPRGLVSTLCPTTIFRPLRDQLCHMATWRRRVPPVAKGRGGAVTGSGSAWRSTPTTPALGGGVGGHTHRGRAVAALGVTQPSANCARVLDGNLALLRFSSTACSAKFQKTFGATRTPENMLRLSLGKVASPVDVRHASAPNVPAVLDRGDTADMWEVRCRMLGLPAGSWG